MFRWGIRCVLSCALALLGEAGSAQFADDQELALLVRRYDWSAEPPSSELPAGYEHEHAVVISEELTFEMARLRLPGESHTFTGDIRQYLRVKANSAYGVERIRAWEIPGYRGARLVLLDARIIRPDGTASSFAGDLLHARHRYTDRERRSSGAIPLTELPIAPGDVFELVYQHSGEGVLAFQENVLAREQPILHKTVTVRAVDMPPPEVDTFNGCPEPEVQAVAGTHERRWTFGPLQPLPRDPLALVKNCVPFFSLRPDRYAGFGSGGFDARYPRDILTGRKHMHVFTKYVEEVRARHAYGDIVGPIAEVVRFIRDSLELVPDSLMKEGEPIGAYFRERRISRQKLYVLYRSLLRILEVPLYICQARSRYEGRFAETITAQNASTDEFIAFLDERTHRFHFIYPNRNEQSFLLDELPVHLYSGRVDLLKYSEGGLHTESLSLDLAALKQNASYQQERIRVELGADGAVRTVDLRGSLGGQLPIALAADTTGSDGGVRRRELNAWIQRHFPLNDIRDLRIERRDSVLPAVWKYTGTGRLPSPDRLAMNGNGEALLVPADLVHWTLPRLPDVNGYRCPRLLPFLCTLRADVAVHSDTPISVPPGADTTFANLFGTFTAAVEQPNANTLVLHYVFDLRNDVVDPSIGPLLGELAAFVDGHLRRPIALRLGAFGER